MSDEITDKTVEHTPPIETHTDWKPTLPPGLEKQDTPKSRPQDTGPAL